MASISAKLVYVPPSNDDIIKENALQELSNRLRAKIRRILYFEAAKAPADKLQELRTDVAVFQDFLSHIEDELYFHRRRIYNQ